VRGDLRAQQVEGRWQFDAADLALRTENRAFISHTFPMYDDDMSTPTRVRSLPGDSSRVLKSGDFEDRAAWNTVEVILEGDRSKHLVNGRIVNTAWDIKQPDPQNPARMIPLKSGRILLEAEGSEIWFRDVRIKPLGQTPEH